MPDPRRMHYAASNPSNNTATPYRGGGQCGWRENPEHVWVMLFLAPWIVVIFSHSLL